MNKFLKKIIETNHRYTGFTLYDSPIPFKDTLFFSDKYKVIQIHDTTPIEKNNIIGFAGVCKIEDEKVVPLDGDSYSKNMTIIGYDEFYDSEGNLCLDLLVDKW